MADARLDPHDRHQRVAAYRMSAGDERFLQSLNAAMAHADLAMPPSDAASSTMPIIYVVGAPRSGTTLLSQVISRGLPVGYIDNVTARFWSRPSAGLTMAKILLGERKHEQIAFESQHGVSAGLAGPHEYGRFWRYWLRLDEQPTHHLSAAALSTLDAAGLAQTLRAELLSVEQRPVVFKNVICGFQAAWLSRVHSPSLFVHIDRPLQETCASILRSRIDRYGTADAWWSLKPSTFEAIARHRDPAEQVVAQVIDCRREFREELSRDGVRSLAVSYQSLCDDPSRVLHQIADAVTALGHPLTPLAGVPARFERRPPPQLPATLGEALQAAVDVASVQEGN